MASYFKDKKTLRYLEWGGVFYLLVLIIVFFYLDKLEFCIGIIVGGLIAFSNFRLMEYFCEKLLKMKSTKKSYMTGQVILKTSFPLLMVLLAFFVFEINFIGLTLGLSAIVAAIMGYGVFLMGKQVFLNNK